MITVAVIFFARPAGADPVSDLQSRAAQLSRAMIQEQLEIDTDQQQSYVATGRVDQINAQLAQTRQEVAVDEHRISADRKALQREVISAYVDAGSTPGVPLLFQSQNRSLLQQEYHDVAFGNTAVTIDQLQTAQNALVAEQGVFERQQAVAQSDQAEAAGALGRAQDVQHQLADQQSQVNGQLAAAIAQQQAAEEARAQARQAAAAAAAAAAASVASVPSAHAPGGGAPTGGGGAAADPGLPPFLACAMQAESGGNYGDVSANGLYMGAFQFLQATWNEAAQLAGLPGLVGVAPNTASKADQDTLAVALFNADGEQPWNDSCRT